MPAPYSVVKIRLVVERAMTQAEAFSAVGGDISTVTEHSDVDPVGSVATWRMGPIAKVGMNPSSPVSFDTYIGSHGILAS